MHIEKKNQNNLYKLISHEIDQIEFNKISTILHVISDFRVKNIFAECNFHIHFLKVSGCNQCILATFKQRNYVDFQHLYLFI